ncbi:NAD-dependent epimerase/dehydratase family protein [Agrobacterium rosae]|uniref:NAD-dependent epimerase/dehydratase family protein n=1 Tax=Agrobacterium rosae TaxID=1972867 RepID=UPI00122EABA4|nr:NAD-dependent epimerase/dehydratase family protein [Agrobacterium rosae]KAA3507675.1 NAD(P)-dependent oxidoreductase [Agrobacterium rosae]KAA3512555.1 NAD(P)-dependent oxidoreductase [Agrobacterium rosae]MQB51260.1 NAD(P)-dependent oxidoreductase [Agrobacterium rosae]
MASALIGYTGFVGANIARQLSFEGLYNSSNIEEMRDEAFEHVVCAGVRAVKWWANKNPSEDLAEIEKLVAVLKTVRADSFTLISTVDVYPDASGVDEATTVLKDSGEPYGRHRLGLEHIVKELFDQVHIVRLPALFGDGLKKNALFDMMTDNRLDYVSFGSSFQWYDLSRLGQDIKVIEDAGLDVVNLVTEPVVTKEIQEQFFADKMIGSQAPHVVSYDVRTVHNSVVGGHGGYISRKSEVLADIGRFLNKAEVGI